MRTHPHQWTIYSGSGFGRAYKLRHCEECNRYETMMYDISKKQLTWVEGNFFEDIDSPIFIVAEEEDALKEVVQQLSKENEENYHHVRTANDLNAMKLWVQPRFILARDWKETALSDTKEFRLLCNTGHF